MRSGWSYADLSAHKEIQNQNGSKKIIYQSKNFQEAIFGIGRFYFGSKQRPPMTEHFNDLINNGQKSRFYGAVFLPERLGYWTCRENAAFWAGVISMLRDGCLVTDIDHFNEKKVATSGSIQEARWLMDYNYTPVKDPYAKNKIWFIAPDSIDVKKNFIIEYKSNSHETSETERLENLT